MSEFNVIFLVDLGFTDGLKAENLESLATLCKISCLKILSHFHGRGGVGWQYKFCRLSNQPWMGQTDTHSPSSFYRFRSFKLSEFERFEAALDSAFSTPSPSEANRIAIDSVSVVRKLNRLLVELISCDWSVVSVSSPVKSTRGNGRSALKEVPTDERNNFVFILSSSHMFGTDLSIIDPTTIANLVEQYKVATFLLDISAYLQSEEQLASSHSLVSLHECLAKAGGGLVPVAAILQDFVCANGRREGLCLAPSTNGNVFAGSGFLPNSSVLSCLFRENCEEERMKGDEKKERRVFSIYTHYAGSRLKIATMWSSPVLTESNGDEMSTCRHINEAVICGTVAAQLLPSFPKQNVIMLDAHEETNGFKSTLLKAQNKNVSLILCCKSDRNDQLPSFGILQPLSDESALLNILTRRNELGWYKQLEFVGNDGEKSGCEADLNLFVQRTVTHFAQNYREKLHSPVKERNTSESETDSEIEAMPTATAITEGWYKDGVSSAVKDFFQKQKEKMKLVSHQQSTAELKVLDQLEMLYARKLSAIASRQREHKSSDGVSSTASSSYSQAASERTRKLLRHASVNKLCRTDNQTSLKGIAEENSGEKNKRRKSVLERRAHTRRQRLDALLTQIQLITIASTDVLKEVVEDTVVTSLSTGRSALEMFLVVRESLKIFGRSQTWGDNIDLFVHDLVQRNLLKSASQIAEECATRNDSATFKIELLKLHSLLRLSCMKDPETVTEDDEVNLDPVVSFVRSLSFVGGMKMARSFLDEDVVDSFVHCIPMTVARIYQQLEQPLPMELEKYAVDNHTDEEGLSDRFGQSPAQSEQSRSSTATPTPDIKMSASQGSTGTISSSAINRSSAIFPTSSHRTVAVTLPKTVKQKSESALKPEFVVGEKFNDDRPKRDKKLKTQTVADTPSHKQMPRSAYLRQKHSAKCRKLLMVKESPVKRLTASASHYLRKSPRSRQPTVSRVKRTCRTASANSSSSKESEELSLAEPFVSPIKWSGQNAKDLFKDVLADSPVQKLTVTPCKDSSPPKRLKIVFRLSTAKKPNVGEVADRHKTPQKSVSKGRSPEKKPIQLVSLASGSKGLARKNLADCFTTPKKLDVEATLSDSLSTSTPMKRSLRSDTRAAEADQSPSTVVYKLPSENADSYRKYVEHLKMETLESPEGEVFYGRGTLRYSVFHGEYSGVYEDTKQQKKTGKGSADTSVDHMASYLLNVLNPNPLDPVRFDRFKSPIKASRFGSRSTRLRTPQKVSDSIQIPLEHPRSPALKPSLILSNYKGGEGSSHSTKCCLTNRKRKLESPTSPKSGGDHSYNCRSKGKVPTIPLEFEDSDEEEFV